jgi:hypothetical protein
LCETIKLHSSYREIDTRTRDWKSKSLKGTYCGIVDPLVAIPPEGAKLMAELVKVLGGEKVVPDAVLVVVTADETLVDELVDELLDEVLVVVED